MNKVNPMPESVDGGMIKNRFMGHVEITTSCWIYRGGHFKTGYGAFWYKGNNRHAHRIAYLIFKGFIPKNICVCHTCDNKYCVNPSHLFLGTIQDNNLDMYSKNRQSGPIGEKNKGTKLSQSTVDEIRALYDTGELTTKQIGLLYNIPHPTAGAIVNGTSWKYSYLWWE